MFVRRSTYEAALKAQFDAEIALRVHVSAARKNRDDLAIIERFVLAMGGVDAIKRAVDSQRRPQPSALSQNDCKRLLMLIHPDKRGGKQAAVEMTQKILAIRDGRA